MRCSCRMYVLSVDHVRRADLVLRLLEFVSVSQVETCTGDWCGRSNLWQGNFRVRIVDKMLQLSGALYAIVT